MKKLVLTTCVAVVSLLAFAKPPKKDNSKGLYTYAANQSLKTMYGKVDNLTWSQTKNHMLRANFTQEGEALSVFFDENGNYVATTSEISIEQVPSAARKAIKSKSEGNEVLGLVQYSSDTEMAYFLELNEGGKHAIYKVSGRGVISKFM